MPPIYKKATDSKSLEQAVNKAYSLLENCTICPRKCAVNRLAGETGYCRTGANAKVCSFMPHHGEEPPISGTKGSGTIFFSNCNMSCAYCQNYEFSQLGQGKEVQPDELADFMLQLKASGCHNINLVTPTHVMPQILKAIFIAANKGLNIPIVYNTGGYELAPIINLISAFIDVYLVDMRYGSDQDAAEYSDAPAYPEHNQQAVKTMHSQVGIAKMNKEGIIERGVIIRHLVLPDKKSGSEEIMKFVSREISKDTFISLMSQYTPYHNAKKFKEINRRITSQEYVEAIEIMHKYGLHNGWTQDSGGLERFAGVNIKKSI